MQLVHVFINWFRRNLLLKCVSQFETAKKSIKIPYFSVQGHPRSLSSVAIESLCTTSYHRLNGSSSPVLTATSLSYGKAKNSTPHRIKTPDLIEIKFGTVDYVGEMTLHTKFHVNPSKGGFPANG